MRGKVGLVIGLAAGDVLGARAGRERYEQIKEQALKVWNLDPVQKQVDRAKDFATSTAMAVPGAVWNGAVKVTRAVQGKDATPGQRLDAAIKAGKDGSEDVAKAAERSVANIEKKIDDAASTEDAKKS